MSVYRTIGPLVGKLTFLKDLKKNMSPFCIPKVLKSATKNLKIGEQIKKIMQEHILNRVFFHCKIASKGSN